MASRWAPFASSRCVSGPPSRWRALALAIAIGIAACSGSPTSSTTTPPPPPPSVASVKVTPATSSVAVGATIQLSAAPLAADGTALSGQTITWSSANAAIATVSNSGVVTGVTTGGPVTISASAGGVSGAASITVTPAGVASVAVTPISATVAVGAAVSLTATPLDTHGNALTGHVVTWTTGNAAVATVSSAGVVTGVAAGGPVTISATSDGISGTASVAVVSVATAAVAQMTATLDSTHAAFVRFAAQLGGNPAQSLAMAAAAVRAEPDVHSAILVDSTELLVQMNSGVQTEFSFDQLGANGLSVTRGGARAVRGRAAHATIPPGLLHRRLMTITNKNVLICAPDYSTFYQPGEIAPVIDTINSSEIGATVSVLTDNNCGYFTVSQFSNYGLVILDTHGTPDSFETGDTLALPTNPPQGFDMQAAIDGQLGPGATQLITGQDLRLDVITTVPAGNTPWWTSGSGTTTIYRISVTSKYLSDVMPSLSGTAIFANMCYSGWQATTPDSTTGIAAAFQAKNPLMYYGYALDDGTSSQVSNDFAKTMEDSLVHALFIDEDSLQIANLKARTNEFADPATIGGAWFRHFGPAGVAYDFCGVPLPDKRDGQSYATVCEGAYRWMKQNLNYAASGSFCYLGDAANCTLYGLLYPGNLMLTAVCPVRWHVPSTGEWNDLIAKLGGGLVAGGKLKEAVSGHWKSPNTGATNSSGFTALPGGYYNYSNLLFGVYGFYYELGETALFGTSTPTPGDEQYPFVVHLSYLGADVYEAADQALAGSIRCLHDYR